jgi:hypothetical protein
MITSPNWVSSDCRSSFRQSQRQPLQAPTARDLHPGDRHEQLVPGWPQEKAAENAGLNIRHYQKVEDGSVNGTLKTVEQVATAFGWI